MSNHIELRPSKKRKVFPQETLGFEDDKTSNEEKDNRETKKK
jgi:hypothetical protein